MSSSSKPVTSANSSDPFSSTAIASGYTDPPWSGSGPSRTRRSGREWSTRPDGRTRIPFRILSTSPRIEGDLCTRLERISFENRHPLGPRRPPCGPSEYGPASPETGPARLGCSPDPDPFSSAGSPSPSSSGDRSSSAASRAARSGPIGGWGGGTSPASTSAGKAAGIPWWRGAWAWILGIFPFSSRDLEKLKEIWSWSVV